MLDSTEAHFVIGKIHNAVGCLGTPQSLANISKLCTQTCREKLIFFGLLLPSGSQTHHISARVSGMVCHASLPSFGSNDCETSTL